MFYRGSFLFQKYILYFKEEKCQKSKFTNERLCGAAQWEICMQIEKALDRYYDRADEYTQQLSLKEYCKKTKCQFGYYSCNRPCPLGQPQAFTREENTNLASLKGLFFRLRRGVWRIFWIFYLARRSLFHLEYRLCRTR